MADIKVYCSHCNTEYEVPEEYLGQVAECGQCSKCFDIKLPSASTAAPLSAPPPPSEITDDSEIPLDDVTLSTDTADVSGIADGEEGEEAEPEEPTSTIKLSRSSIGMVPEVQDSFKLDVVNRISEAPSQPTGTGTKKDMGDTVKNNFKSQFTTETAPEKPSALQPKPQKLSFLQLILGFFKKKK